MASIGTIASALFAWRGKKEDTRQKHDDTTLGIVELQNKLVKDLTDEVNNLRMEITGLRSDNTQLRTENEALRKQVKTLNDKLDELMAT
ncbi:hypothetical protein [Leuconostoc citreum]|uniref:hypothetical protein n=1 Tax=Leuconostoc citreum TaxID=33964 RepID=UPI0032E028D6